MNEGMAHDRMMTISEQRTILVTGGAGFIGSNLVRYLLRQNYRVVILDAFTYAGNPASLEGLNTDLFSVECASITDKVRVAGILQRYQPDAIMHLAAESHVDRSIDHPLSFVETNVLGTCVLLHEALNYYRGLGLEKQHIFRFLHVSTDEVYGSLGAEGYFTEETPYAPRSPYSASKAASDHFVKAWFETYGLPIVMTNCSNNYGPFQFPEKLIPVVILKAMRGEPIPVYGRGENIRDWLYVEDHCDALLRVLQRGRLGETYNVGGGHEMSNLDLVQHICRLLDAKKPRANGQSYMDLIHFVSDRPGHDFRYAIDSSKIQQELGWKAQYSFDEALSATIVWYLEHQVWWEQILSGEYRMERLGVANK